MNTIVIENEIFHLLPDRAIFWPRAATLFIADLHWGKTATFRAAGLALPGGEAEDLARLGRLITATGASRVVILGDLLHARSGRNEQVFNEIAAWREQQATEMLLVRGNHDQRAGDPPADWRITVVDAPFVMEPFVLHHYPQEDARGYVLAGHLHPHALLRGGGRQHLKLPCFWFGSRVGVLPAFGGFTGTAAIAPAAGDRVFIIADDSVIERTVSE